MKPRLPRKLKQMSAETDHMRESDRLFFERFPWRQHRLRRLGRAEIEQLEEATGAVLVVTEPNTAMFVIVKNLASGARLRLHVPGPADETGDDATEAQIAALWARRAARNPALAHQEMQIQEALKRPGGPLHKTRGGE